MQEVDGRIELSSVAAAFSRGQPGLLPAGVVPPLARRLTLHGDHRIDEHQGQNAQLGGDERRGKSAEGLRHEHDPGRAVGRPGHEAGVLGQAGGRVVARQVHGDGLGQAGGRVVARQVHGDGLMAGLLQQRYHQIPVRRRAASARDEDICALRVTAIRDLVILRVVHTPTLGLIDTKRQSVALDSLTCRARGATTTRAG